jgi:hypothetical protein
VVFLPREIAVRGSSSAVKKVKSVSVYGQSIKHRNDSLEHIDRDMMDKRPFDHVLSSTDIP